MQGIFRLVECGGADILLFGYTQLLYLIFDKFTFNNNGCDNMRTCPNCGHEMLNDNFAECPKCGFNLYSHNKKNNSLFSNINKKLPKSIGDISEQITTQVKKEEAYIKSRLDDDSTALVDDNEFFISKTVLDGVDYITNKKQEFEKGRTSKNENKNTTSVKVDNNINQETKKPKKDISTKQKIDETNSNNLELFDLQETLINTLPLIDNPSEYEEDIIKKYSEYSSEERKELLKDCWTITKLAEKHNIKRQEVEKAILTDEFLEKDLIGVFKVNPNNIRSLKILYRKPLTEIQQPQDNKQLKKETLDETKEEPIQEFKINDNKKQKESRKKGLFGRNSSEKKEFEKKLEELCGGILSNDAFDKKAREHGTLTGIGGTPPANTNYKKILKAEFKAGTLKVDDVENRLDELFDLDVDQLERKVRMKKEDTSVFKTQEDLNNRFGEEYAEKFRRKDKEYREGALFEEYGINTEEAYCFECTIEERRSSTFSNTDRRNVDTAYVALFDDYIAIIKESVFLKSNMGIRKVYFNNVTSIDYDTSGKLGLSSSLFLNMHSGEHVQLKFISKETVDEVQQRYEKFINEKNVSNTVQINQETSNADELLKYAELYKQGLLSEEEFEAKKKELL